MYTVRSRYIHNQSEDSETEILQREREGEDATDVLTSDK